jgi:hypothetical protein
MLGHSIQSSISIAAGLFTRTARAICIVDQTGKIVREGAVTSDPETIAAFIKSQAPHVARVGLEAGATSTWLWTGIDARHAKAVLKMQIGPGLTPLPCSGNLRSIR